MGAFGAERGAPALERGAGRARDVGRNDRHLVLVHRDLHAVRRRLRERAQLLRQLKHHAGRDVLGGSHNCAEKQAEGADITTIEGLADGDELHPMQEAFHENHGLQCGFCTPGMVMSAVEMVTKNKDISEDEIREGLEGNICRCTGYHNIVQSVKAGAAKMGGKN